MNSQVEIDYVNYRGERGTRTIRPMQLAFGTNGFHGETPQWLLTADDAEKGLRVFTMNDVRRWGTWNEDAERKQFEDACYAQYLAKRDARKAQGFVSVFDKSEDKCWPREQLFARESSGQYVALVYRGAWFGWKMARKVD